MFSLSSFNINDSNVLVNMVKIKVDNKHAE